MIKEKRDEDNSRQMKKINITSTGGIRCNESTGGAEMLEEKIKRALENGEAIEEGADITFTEREEGVKHEFNPRGDKWEMAVEATGQKAKSQLAQRQDALEKKKDKDKQVETPPKEGA